MKHATLRALVAASALALAGCVRPTEEHGGHAATLDTGDIPPGDTATLAYADEGTLDILCHPHPFMEHDVTVTQAAPTRAHVHILDGPTPDEYRFEPATLQIGKGSLVDYHNHGNLTHTATQK